MELAFLPIGPALFQSAAAVSIGSRRCCSVRPWTEADKRTLQNRLQKRGNFSTGLRIFSAGAKQQSSPLFPGTRHTYDRLTVCQLDGDNIPSESEQPPSPPKPRVALFRSLSIPALVAAALAMDSSGSLLEMLRQIPLSAPVAVAMAIFMEPVAHFLHSKIWHNWLYWMHESHHEHRTGAFELNDFLSCINAPIAIAMMYYGLHGGAGTLGGEILLGMGIGMTMFGFAYVLIHDGYCHNRLPVEFFGNIPYLKRVRASHLVHHGENAGGAPFGLFYGPWELRSVQQQKKEEKIRERVLANKN